jgi:hypothetical protein
MNDDFPVPYEPIIVKADVPFLNPLPISSAILIALVVRM